MTEPREPVDLAAIDLENAGRKKQHGDWFVLNGERWFRERGKEFRLLDLAPNLEAQYQQKRLLRNAPPELSPATVVIDALLALVRQLNAALEKVHDWAVAVVEDGIENEKFSRAMRVAGGGQEVRDDDTPMPHMRVFEEEAKALRAILDAALALTTNERTP